MLVSERAFEAVPMGLTGPQKNMKARRCSGAVVARALLPAAPALMPAFRGVHRAATGDLGFRARRPHHCIRKPLGSVASSAPVVTVMERGPVVIPAITVNCAVSVVPFTAFTLLTRIPGPASTCDEALKLVFCP